MQSTRCRLAALWCMIFNRFEPYGESERAEIEFSPSLSITLDMTRSTLEQILAPTESRIQSEHPWMAEGALRIHQATFSFQYSNLIHQ